MDDVERDKLLEETELIRAKTRCVTIFARLLEVSERRLTQELQDAASGFVASIKDRLQ